MEFYCTIFRMRKLITMKFMLRMEISFDEIRKQRWRRSWKLSRSFPIKLNDGFRSVLALGSETTQLPLTCVLTVESRMIWCCCCWRGKLKFLRSFNVPKNDENKLWVGDRNRVVVENLIKCDGKTSSMVVHSDVEANQKWPTQDNSHSQQEFSTV